MNDQQPQPLHNQPANQSHHLEPQTAHFADRDFYDKALLSVIIAVALVQLYLFAQLAHVTSPIFGGDLYRERGFVQYIVNGNGYWHDPYFKGELEFYPPLGYLLGAALVKLTGASVDTITSFLPVLTTTLLILAFYRLGAEIFKRKKFALLLALAGISQTFFVLKYTFALSIVFALYFLTYFLKLSYDASSKTKIRAGIFWGLSALSHYEPFLFTTVMVTIVALTEFFYAYTVDKKIIKNIIALFKQYSLTLVIAVLISLIFFGPLIVTYHLKTPNRTQEFSQFDVTKHGITWVVQSVVNQFIQTTSLSRFIFGTLGILGILACVLNKNKLEQRYTLTLLLGMIVSGGHYLITRPLFHVWIVPSHMIAGLFIPAVILTVWGIRFCEALLEKTYPGKGFIIAPLFIIISILPLLSSTVDSYNNDQWTLYGRTMDPMTRALYDFGDWALKNTHQDEVFLANDESAFAINALSGRYVVAVRRTHASPYADVDERYADAIVMLYGNDTTVVKDLVKKYSVQYVYIDQYLLSEPMITRTVYKQYLEKNGVKFVIQNVRLDPAGIDTPLYESIVVPPQPLTITNLSRATKQFTAGNQIVAAVYTINQ